MLLLLCGCSAKEAAVVEYVTDTWAAPAYTLVFSAPQEFSQQTFAEGEVYQSQDGAVLLVSEVMPGADLEQAVQAVSGFSWDELEHVCIEREEWTECYLSWACVTEQGVQLSRCTLMDDGKCCYALTMTQPADQVSDNRQLEEDIFSTVSLEKEAEV